MMRYGVREQYVRKVWVVRVCGAMLTWAAIACYLSPTAFHLFGALTWAALFAIKRHEAKLLRAELPHVPAARALR